MINPKATFLFLTSNIFPDEDICQIGVKFADDNDADRINVESLHQLRVDCDHGEIKNRTQ
jgi:hypothetical protein